MKNEITYTQQGDYFLPDLKLPEQPKVVIGIWGRRHERYIKQHHKLHYFDLLTSCKLTAYLADIDREAAEKWLADGAQPTEVVARLFKNEGIIK